MLRSISLVLFFFTGQPFQRLDRIHGRSPGGDRLRIVVPILFAHSDFGLVGVEWFNEKPENLLKEASFAAARAAEACPVASSIQVWAQDKAAPKSRVFQALISTSGATRIKLDKVADFADTRYVKLFEKVCE